MKRGAAVTSRRVTSAAAGSSKRAGGGRGAAVLGADADAALLRLRAAATAHVACQVHASLHLGHPEQRRKGQLAAAARKKQNKTQKQEETDGSGDSRNSFGNLPRCNFLFSRPATYELVERVCSRAEARMEQRDGDGSGRLR